METDIADKETRLAYLMQDTSGANAMEIAALQQEIAQDKQGYTDSLVDQQLQSLQDANEAAAEQRQQQIDLQQAQLDLYANSAEIWTEVQNILLASQVQAQAANDFNEAWSNTVAAEYMRIANGTEALNPIEREIAENTSAGLGKESAIYTGIAGLTQQEAEGVIAEGQQLSSINTSLSETGAIAQALGDKGSITGSVSAVKDETLKVKTETEKVKTEMGKTTTGVTKLGNTTIPTEAGSIEGAIHSAATAVSNAVKPESPDLSPSGAPTSTPGSGNNTNTNTGTSANDGYPSGQDGGGGMDNNTPQEPAKPAKLELKDALTSLQAYYTYKGNVFDWHDMMVDNENDDGPFELTTKSGATKTGRLRAKKPGSNSKALLQAAKDAGIESNQFFYISEEKAEQIKAERGGMIVEAGYYMMAKNKDYVAQIVKDKLDYAMLGDAKRFSTGGVADFTGPAWLDGTKSKPEIVLDQTDSANFMQLRDIFADILNGTSSIPKATEGKGGDNYYEINIDVESISDDYDVEQLADKIKDMIYEDSIYRNVNSINTVR